MNETAIWKMRFFYDNTMLCLIAFDVSLKFAVYLLHRFHLMIKIDVHSGRCFVRIERIFCFNSLLIQLNFINTFETINFNQISNSKLLKIHSLQSKNWKMTLLKFNSIFYKSLKFN